MALNIVVGINLMTTVHDLVWRRQVYSVSYGWQNNQPVVEAKPSGPLIVAEFLTRMERMKMKPGVAPSQMHLFTGAARGGVCFWDDPGQGE